MSRLSATPRRLLAALASGAVGLVASTAAALAFEGRYKAGTEEYVQELRVTRADGGLRVKAYVSTKGCVGEVDAKGRIAGGTLSVRARNDFGECRLSLKRQGAAIVLDEESCLTFHGSACGFSGTYQPVRNAPR